MYFVAVFATNILKNSPTDFFLIKRTSVFFVEVPLPSKSESKTNEAVRLSTKRQTWTYMWRHLRKGTLLRNKYHRPWSDAAHDARRPTRAFDKCRSLASEENICCRFICIGNQKYYRKTVKTADLGGHCLFRSEFRWWRHILEKMLHLPVKLNSDSNNKLVTRCLCPTPIFFFVFQFFS